MSETQQRTVFLLKTFTNVAPRGATKKWEPTQAGRIVLNEDGNLDVNINPGQVLQGAVLAERYMKKDLETGEYPDKPDMKVSDPREWVLKSFSNYARRGEPDNWIPHEVAKVVEKDDGDLELRVPTSSGVFGQLVGNPPKANGAAPKI